jgi:hypothetical protein
LTTFEIEATVIQVKKASETGIKLMIASDNSAKSAGEIFEGIMRKANLTPT